MEDNELLAKLIPSKKTEKVLLPVSGVEIEVQSLNFGELMLIFKQSKGDNMEFGKWAIFKGLSKPKLTTDQIDKLSPKDATEIITQVMNVSGYTPDTSNFLNKPVNLTIPSDSGT
jgi:hypothetical protein